MVSGCGHSRERVTGNYSYADVKDLACITDESSVLPGMGAKLIRSMMSSIIAGIPRHSHKIGKARELPGVVAKKRPSGQPSKPCGKLAVVVRWSELPAGKRIVAGRQADEVIKETSREQRVTRRCLASGRQPRLQATDDFAIHTHLARSAHRARCFALG